MVNKIDAIEHLRARGSVEGLAYAEDFAILRNGLVWEDSHLSRKRTYDLFVDPP